MLLRHIFNKETLGAITLSALVANTTIANTASTEPFIEITHPNGVTRRIDCGTLTKKGEPPKLFVTCEFGRQVDINSQSICSDNNTSPSMAFYKYLQHLTTQHGGDCGKAFGNLEKALGHDPDKTAGKHWQDMSQCTLTDAVRVCREVMENEEKVSRTPINE